MFYILKKDTLIFINRMIDVLDLLQNNIGGWE